VVQNATSTAARDPIVASFGIVNGIKQNALPVAALPAVLARCPDVVLVFVGPCADAERTDLIGLADALGVSEHVIVTGAVTDAEYAAWLDRACLAVQLRRTANGESSGTVADCLAAGVVPIVSGIGAGRDLPPDGVVSVGSDVSADDLAAAVLDLLGDPDHRRGLVSAGRRYAAAHSHAIVARRLFEDVIRPTINIGLTVARNR
jgi:phosphatidylinositol alpha-mannosyltransferase